jgi:hypothetical protein
MAGCLRACITRYFPLADRELPPQAAAGLTDLEKRPALVMLDKLGDTALDYALDAKVRRTPSWPRS